MLVVCKIGANAAANNNNVGLEDWNGSQKSTTNAISNLIPGSFALDVSSVLPVRPVDGLSRGKCFPFAYSAVVFHHAAANLTKAECMMDLSIGNNAAANTSADGDIE